MKEAGSGVVMLEVETEIMGSRRTICPTIIGEGSGAVLVDTGFPGEHSRAALHAALQEAGVAVDSLRAIVITHQDVDHIGGLPGLVADTRGRAEVLAQVTEAPYIEGEKQLVKFAPQAASGTGSLSEETRKALQQMVENLPGPK